MRQACQAIVSNFDNLQKFKEDLKSVLKQYFLLNGLIKYYLINAFIENKIYFMAATITYQYVSRITLFHACPKLLRQHTFHRETVQNHNCCAESC